MKSIERRFKLVEEKNPFLGSYICFAQTIHGQNFSRPVISRWFNKIVEKGGYSKSDTRRLIENLVCLSNGVRKGANGVKVAI
jgi:hypothetical protein